MKLRARAYRYLAAFAPLLGLGIAGCGSSFLGDVDGTSAFVPTPTRQVVVTGRASVEGEILAGRQAGDRPVSNGILRVRRYTASGQAVEVPTTSGLAETNENGIFTVTLSVDQTTQVKLWEVEVFGSVQGVGLALLTAPFVPGPNNTLTIAVDMASTLVGASLASSAGAQGDTGTLTNVDIQETAARVRQYVRQQGSALFGSLLTGGNATEARAKLTGLAGTILAVYNALVARLEIVNRFTVLSDSDNPGSITLGVNRDATLVGRALAADGSELAVGIEFIVQSQQPSAAVTVTQTKANEAALRANVLGGSADILARIAVPGQTQAARKQARLKVTVVLEDQGHAQGHLQGGGIGG